MSKDKRKRRNRHVKVGYGTTYGLLHRLPRECALPGKQTAVRVSALGGDLTESVGQRAERSLEHADVSAPGESLWLKAGASIATNAWRAKRRLVDPKTGEPRPDMKLLHRDVLAICRTLEERGFETKDDTGLRYDSGMALKVIGFEETPGYVKEEIKETIKPSVRYHGHLIQWGEVIVGTPPKNETREGRQ